MLPRQDTEEYNINSLSTIQENSITLHINNISKISKKAEQLFGDPPHIKKSKPSFHFNDNMRSLIDAIDIKEEVKQDESLLDRDQQKDSFE